MKRNERRYIAARRRLGRVERCEPRWMLSATPNSDVTLGAAIEELRLPESAPDSSASVIAVASTEVVAPTLRFAPIGAELDGLAPPVDLETAFQQAPRSTILNAASSAAVGAAADSASSNVLTSAFLPTFGSGWTAIDADSSLSELAPDGTATAGVFTATNTDSIGVVGFAAPADTAPLVNLLTVGDTPSVRLSGSSTDVALDTLVFDRAIASDFYVSADGSLTNGYGGSVFVVDAFTRATDISVLDAQSYSELVSSRYTIDVGASGGALLETVVPPPFAGDVMDLDRDAATVAALLEDDPTLTYRELQESMLDIAATRLAATAIASLESVGSEGAVDELEGDYTAGLLADALGADTPESGVSAGRLDEFGYSIVYETSPADYPTADASAGAADDAGELVALQLTAASEPGEGSGRTVGDEDTRVRREGVDDEPLRDVGVTSERRGQIALFEARVAVAEAVVTTGNARGDGMIDLAALLRDPDGEGVDPRVDQLAGETAEAAAARDAALAVESWTRPTSVGVIGVAAARGGVPATAKPTVGANAASNGDTESPAAGRESSTRTDSAGAVSEPLSRASFGEGRSSAHRLATAGATALLGGAFFWGVRNRPATKQPGFCEQPRRARPDV